MRLKRYSFQPAKELKERTKRIYNNINSKTVKSIQEIMTVIALIHSILLKTMMKEVYYLVGSV
ncbi:MAG: hypothetical protein QXI52_05165 [Nitrososphaerota archaeon]